MSSFLCKGNRGAKVVGINLAVLIVFGIVYGVYLNFSDDHWSHSGNDKPFLNGFYASSIIHTSVGFGDFYPKHFIGKILIIIHALFVFLFNLYAGLLACDLI
tara:strand:- start:676 stop:981 length:306 start_codon:yes stop_codon:yes gene_type:complete